MQFGLVLNGAAPEDLSADSRSSYFGGVVEHVQLAEELGFTSVWPFARDLARGDVNASWPQELVSRIAGATRTIRIGHRLWPADADSLRPLQSAEHAATLDLLCDGRLEIDCSVGVAQGVMTPVTVGRSESDWGEMKHALRVVIDAWAKPTLGSTRTFYAMPDNAATVKPVQFPHPPLWMSVADSSGWRLAGELGLGVVVSAPPDTALQTRVDTHRHVSAGAVGAIANRVTANTLAICGDEGDRRLTVHQTARWPSRTPCRSVACTGLLVGNPEECIAAARAYARVGVQRLLCHFPVGGAALPDVMTRFGRDVVTAFE